MDHHRVFPEVDEMAQVAVVPADAVMAGPAAVVPADADREPDMNFRFPMPSIPPPELPLPS